jgi:hypothetical protein
MGLRKIEGDTARNCGRRTRRLSKQALLDGPTNV